MKKSCLLEISFLIILSVVCFSMNEIVRKFDKYTQNYMAEYDKFAKQIEKKFNETVKVSCVKKNCSVNLDKNLLNELKNDYNLKDKYYENQSYWLNYWLTFIGTILAFIAIIMPYLVMKSNEKLEERVNKDIDENIKKIKESEEICKNYEASFKDLYEQKKEEFKKIVEEAKNAIDECHKVVESYRQISDVKQMGNDKVNNNENPYGKKNIIENQNNKVETNIKEVSQNRSALNKFFEKAKLFHEAVELSGKGLYNEAIDKYRNALKLYGKDNEILHNIGYCYYKQKKYSEALEYFNKALAIKENVLTLHGIAVIYFHEKKYKEALEYCDKVLNLSPDLRECLNNKYLIYMKLEEYKKALEVMKKITDTYPVDIGDYYNLTEAYIFNDKFMEAIISLNTYYKNQINPFIYSDDFEEWKAKIEKSDSPLKQELLNLLSKLSLRQREDYV